MRRVAISLLALPWLLALGYGAFTFSTPSGREAGPLEVLPLVLGFALFTYAFIGVIALPLLLLALRFNRASLWLCVFVGTLTALSVLLVFGWPQFIGEQLRPEYRLAQLRHGYPILLLGASAGGLFWFLALRGNPIAQRSKGKQAAPSAA